jgi:hypothetical protein
MQEFRTTGSAPQARKDEAEWSDLFVYAGRAIGIGAVVTLLFWLLLLK